MCHISMLFPSARACASVCLSCRFPPPMQRVLVRVSWFFFMCVLPYGGTGWWGGLSEFLGGGVSNRPPPPLRRVGHCGGFWVSAKGAGQGLLPVVRHFAYGSWVGGWVGGWVDGWVGGWLGGWMGGWVDGWVDGCPVAPPPRGGGTFVGLWVCYKSVVGGSLKSVGGSLKSPPSPHPRGQETPGGMSSSIRPSRIHPQPLGTKIHRPAAMKCRGVSCAPPTAAPVFLSARPHLYPRRSHILIVICALPLSTTPT